MSGGTQSGRGSSRICLNDKHSEAEQDVDLSERARIETHDVATWVIGMTSPDEDPDTAVSLRGRMRDCGGRFRSSQPDWLHGANGMRS